MISPIVGRGYGTFGSVNLVCTRGYGIGSPAPPTVVTAVRSFNIQFGYVQDSDVQFQRVQSRSIDFGRVRDTDPDFGGW